MPPFMSPADAMMLSIRMTLASAEASRTFWCAMMQAGTWWMPQAATPPMPAASAASSGRAAEGRSRTKTARR